jgi:hypothetical protein
MLVVNSSSWARRSSISFSMRERASTRVSPPMRALM